jgi:hypothetical protein
MGNLNKKQKPGDSSGIWNGISQPQVAKALSWAIADSDCRMILGIRQSRRIPACYQNLKTHGTQSNLVIAVHTYAGGALGA